MISKRAQQIVGVRFPRTIAQIPIDGKIEYIMAIGGGLTGFRMQAVVGIVADQAVFVRANRWRRYKEVNRRSKLTGFGDARDYET